MKIGIDIHGVVDSAPEFFSLITKLLVESGSEVHILTGKMVKHGAKEELEEFGISYTHFFSIADFHAENKTKGMWYSDNGNPWVDNETWDRSKADYCREHQIDFHIDDTLRYGDYFTTPFAFMKIKNES